MKKWWKYATVFLVVLLLGVAALVWGRSPESQMEFMSNEFFKLVKGYQWEQMGQGDPVKAGLAEAMGSEYPQTAELLYQFMKENTSDITWETVSCDRESKMAQVRVWYSERSELMEHYKEQLCGYVTESLHSGRIQRDNLDTLVEALDDETQSRLFASAVEQTTASEPVEGLVTVYFHQKYGLYLPQGASEELNDVVTGGLFSCLSSQSELMEQIQQEISVRLIPEIVGELFQTLQQFDLVKLEELMGQSVSDMLGMEEDSAVYQALADYLRRCAGKMTYVVGAYDPEKHTITVDCTCLDSKNVIESYVRSMLSYAFTHWRAPQITDEIGGQLLQSAIDSAAEEYLEKQVVITFDPEDMNRFEVSKELYDVATANLFTEIKELTDFLER